MLRVLCAVAACLCGGVCTVALRPDASAGDGAAEDLGRTGGVVLGQGERGAGAGRYYMPNIHTQLHPINLLSNSIPFPYPTPFPYCLNLGCFFWLNFGCLQNNSFTYIRISPIPL